MTGETETLDVLIERGLAEHRAGRLDAARGSYEAVLTLAPGHFDATHMLGLLAVQQGEVERGAALIEQATQLAPGEAAAHVNLAMALGALGRHAAALASADRALALDPANPDALLNRGNALLALGRPAEALAAYERALALRPGDPRGPYNRGNALRDLGRLEDAIASYGAALILEPGYVEALSNRGETLASLGRLDDALASFEAALRLRPAGETWRNHAAILARLRRLPEALASYDAALAADPASAEAHDARAGVLNDLGHADAALAAADRSLALAPAMADAHNNRGIALYAQGRVLEALASYDQALALAPASAEAHNNRALALLRSGDLAAGFEEYRWRWQVGDARRGRPAVSCPQWDGEPLSGKRLLVFAEQGYGDSLQFVRFVPRLAGLGAQVMLLVEPPLTRLFRASLPDAAVVDRLAADATFDFQAAMLCLPRLLGTTLDSIPAEAPYLAADAVASEAWRRRLAALPGRKIGLVWAGASRQHNPVAVAIDARRSLRLAQFAPLAAAANVTFVSLQLGLPAAQAQAPPPALRLADWTAELRDFADTAALVAALDLVITVDTAVAHLAGALGRPVWILSRFDGCWRWLQGREDSPWYPSARLFHQRAPGAWDEAIGRVAGALAGFKPPAPPPGGR